MNLFTFKHSRLRPLLVASAAAIAIQVPLFGLLDVYPIVNSFPHHSYMLSSLNSLLLYSLVGMLLGTAFWVIVVGVPLFALLRVMRCERMWSCALIGFLIASLPYAYVRWPVYGELIDMSEYRYWRGTEILYTQDGALTVYAWADYFIELMRLGMHGLVAGLVFGWVWRVQSARVVTLKGSKADRNPPHAP